jgi:hypothetical protein
MPAARRYKPRVPWAKAVNPVPASWDGPMGELAACGRSPLTPVGPGGAEDTGRAFLSPRSGTRQARALPHP